MTEDEEHEAIMARRKARLDAIVAEAGKAGAAWWDRFGPEMTRRHKENEAHFRRLCRQYDRYAEDWLDIGPTTRGIRTRDGRIV